MAESENIKEAVSQVAVQMAMVVMIALRDIETGLWLTIIVSHREPQRQKYSGLIPVKLALNWGAKDRYSELMNFEMEVLTILENKSYEFLGEQEVPVTKYWLG